MQTGTVLSLGKLSWFGLMQTLGLGTWPNKLHVEEEAKLTILLKQPSPFCTCPLPSVDRPSSWCHLAGGW